jgi:nucleotide-binding universal stress UspA family protein
LREGEADSEIAPNPAGMSGWLMRHGVRADVERTVTSLRIADALLDRTEALGSELLVMGGYGHARMHEQLLGGVTRDVLAQSRVPVLMTH